MPNCLGQKGIRKNSLPAVQKSQNKMGTNRQFGSQARHVLHRPSCLLLPWPQNPPIRHVAQHLRWTLHLALLCEPVQDLMWTVTLRRFAEGDNSHQAVAIYLEYNFVEQYPTWTLVALSGNGIIARNQTMRDLMQKTVRRAQNRLKQLIYQNN